MIVDGIVDGKQDHKLETVVPQTDLNMVGHSLILIKFQHLDGCI